MATAQLNFATKHARKAAGGSITAAKAALDRLSDSWPGSVEHFEQADRVVEVLEAALATSRDLAALAHADAAQHHGEAARPGFESALRRWGT